MATDDRSRHALARILDTPSLARAIPRLPPVVLHQVIQSCGLEDCGELVALATPEQLAAVFDLDLWRSAHPGLEETFDAARFAQWLDVLVESGSAVAAQKLSEIDPATVVVALAQYIAVFDLAAVDEDHLPAILKEGVSCEVGGYIVAATRERPWDTIVDLLLALDEGHRDYFDRVMRGCRRLSNSTPELDGFHDLMTDPEQARFDLGVDRERRRDTQGYIPSEQARAFLESSRHVRVDRDGLPRPHPIATAYLRVSSDADPETEPAESVSSPDERTASEVAAIVDVLRDAGVIPDQPRALLGAGDEPTSRLVRMHRHMELVRHRDPAAYASRSQELAFLANVLVAGCSVQGRLFTAREAFDAAVAICNLGLEKWPQELPEDFLVAHELTSVFQLGWSVLHRDVCVLVAEQLVAVLGGLEISDRDIRIGLLKLRRDLTRHLEAGEPWRARDALDVIAILDMPAWAALLGLISECPVMLANVAPASQSRPHSIDPAVFEFVSCHEHIAAVRAFMESLPDALTR